jgi:hypothetical protein
MQTSRLAEKTTLVPLRTRRLGAALLVERANKQLTVIFATSIRVAARLLHKGFTSMRSTRLQFAFFLQIVFF